jgi:hypothetical protein
MVACGFLGGILGYQVGPEGEDLFDSFGVVTLVGRYIYVFTFHFGSVEGHGVLLDVGLSAIVV